MKLKSFVAVVSLISSLSSFADLAEKHQAFCDSDAVKSVKTEKDSCRVLIVPEVTAEDVMGTCSGKVKKIVPCEVIYAVGSKGGAMKVMCGDAKDPLFDQMLAASSASYKVAAVIEKEDGTEVVVNDPNAYSIFESQLMNVTLAESTDASGKVTSTGTMELDLRDSSIELDSVVCKKL